MATLLLGKPVREKISLKLKEKIEKLGREPVLAIIQVGDRGDSNLYIKNKQKFGEEIGVLVRHHKFDEEVDEEFLVQEIKRLNQDKSVDGIIVQLPLPPNLNTQNILGSVDITKDADGLNNKEENNFKSIMPATARAVLAILNFYNIEVVDKKVAVIGRSRLVGAPVADSLRNGGAKVTSCNRSTQNIEDICKDSDIIISAAGQASLVGEGFVRAGQVVIDIGINRLNGNICGDVAFNEVEPIVSAITPVPGGVGPVTVAALFENLVTLCYHS